MTLVRRFGFWYNHSKKHLQETEEFKTKIGNTMRTIVFIEKERCNV